MWGNSRKRQLQILVELKGWSPSFSLLLPSLWGPGLSSYLMEAEWLPTAAGFSLSLINSSWKNLCLSKVFFFFLRSGLESPCPTESHSAPLKQLQVCLRCSTVWHSPVLPSSLLWITNMHLAKESTLSVLSLGDLDLTQG